MIYLVSPQLALDKSLVLVTVFAAFWIATAINFFGISSSDWFSRAGAVIGTLLPVFLIIVLAAAWWLVKKPLNPNWSASGFFPKIHNLRDLAVLSGMLFGLVGMEMSAVHAQDVKNPQRDYPKALLISAVVILVTSILASLAIAWLIPANSLNLVDSLVKSFSIYLHQFGFGWALPWVVGCILIGGLSSVSAWVIGPAKCMLTACDDLRVWSLFSKQNRYGAPWAMLLLQGGLFSVFCLLFWIFPGFNRSYWLLSDMTAQISVIFYVFLFLAMIRLRYKLPQVVRPYRVPAGRFGVFLCVGLGLLTCAFVFGFGFLPPLHMGFQSVGSFAVVMLVGVIVICALPWWFMRSNFRQLSK